MNVYYEPWTEFASCREVGGDSWYPEDREDRQTPKAICLNRCPVRLQCLDYAMRREQGVSESYRWGIFGGLSPAKRAKYEAQWLAEQAVSAA